MPRELRINNENKIRMLDGMTGESFWFTHRTVTSEDIVKYQVATMNILTAKKSSSIEELIKVQLESGKELVTSVQPGYFMIDGKSIDDTYPGWKDAIAHTACDTLIALAKHLLGVNSYVTNEKPEPYPQPKED